MGRRIVFCLAFFLAALTIAGRSRAVQRPSALPTPKSVLWIAAHPDDEAVIAPLLAFWCRDQHARCALLVLTRGEAGPCMRSEGCIPDLGTVRSAEAGAASEYFGAASILLTFPDGGGSVAPAWDVNAGGSPDVIPTITNYIRAVAPEAVVTFDPRHGTTCHPDHRAIGNIVADAVKQIAAAPQLYFLETRVTFDAEPFAVHFLAAITSAERFDANLPLAFTRGAAWNAVSDDMQRHSSQFDGRWIAAIQNVPAAQRSVFLMPAAAAAQQSVSIPCQ